MKLSAFNHDGRPRGLQFEYYISYCREIQFIIYDQDTKRNSIGMYPFPGCTTLVVSGTISSGKTSWVFKLLKPKDVMFETAPEKILYCHAIEQPLFLEMGKKTLPSIKFHKGLPSDELIEEYSHSKTCNIIVLDDLMDSVVRKKFSFKRAGVKRTRLFSS